jgi:hypothetical protein
MSGLSYSFNSFVTVIMVSTRKAPMTVVDFPDELLNHELLLNQQTASSVNNNFALLAEVAIPLVFPQAPTHFVLTILGGILLGTTMGGHLWECLLFPGITIVYLVLLDIQVPMVLLALPLVHLPLVMVHLLLVFLTDHLAKSVEKQVIRPRTVST